MKNTKFFGILRYNYRINRPSGDYPNYSIIEIGQNTEKSPGDLKRLSVTQTPVKDHQLTLYWKTIKRENNDDNNNTKKSPRGLEETCFHSDSSGILLVNTCVKNFQRSIINNNYNTSPVKTGKNTPEE